MANKRRKVKKNISRSKISPLKGKIPNYAEIETDALFSVSEQSKLIEASAKQTAEHLEAQASIQESIASAAKKNAKASKENTKASKENTKASKEQEEVEKKVNKNKKKYNDSQKETNKLTSAFGAALTQVGRSGIPLMSELSDLIQNIGKNAGAAKLALTALGAAAGGLAANYFGAEPQALIKAENERAQIRIDGAAEQSRIEFKRNFINRKIEIERNQLNIDTANQVNQLTIEAANSSKRAAIQFSSQMQMGAAEFNAAAKTAYFGNGVGSVAYSAAQMQLAGVGAEQVAQSLSAATKELGSRPSSAMAADMAILEKRTGASADNISSMFSFFKRTDKVSAGTALNMVEGMRAMANSANIDLGGMMEEVAAATKDAYSYQIKSGAALQKQVAYASSIGVSFNDVAKAGRSMVLNYKDSIKNEMQLSAMLGRNVNLSEARALFAQGKTDEALKSIKGQGLDPTKMNMFQQEALSQALGGLDLNSLQKISTTNGKNVSATTGNVKGGNQGFLSRTQGAQSTLAAQQASISAQTAILDAKLSGKIQAEYLESTKYKEYQNQLLDNEKKAALYAQNESASWATQAARVKQIAETTQQAIKNSFTENWMTALGAAAGATMANVLANLLFKSPIPVKVVGPGGDLPDALTKNGGGMKIGSEARKNLKRISNSPVLRTLYKGSKVLSKGLKVLGPAAAIVGAGFDFMGRKEQGQTNLQAGAGVAGGSAGAFGGAALGASIGSVVPVVGTIIGGAIGGALGYWGGSSIADAITGAGNPEAKKAGATAAKNSIKSGGSTSAPSTMTLSDVQYQTRLQTEMVALLGMSSGFLKQLLEISSAEFDRPINLNGTKLNATLLASARKNYGVARSEKVGAYKAP